MVHSFPINPMVKPNIFRQKQHFSRHPPRCPQLRRPRALRRPRRGPPVVKALEAMRRAPRRCDGAAGCRRAYGEWESPITATGWQEKLQVLWIFMGMF